MPRNVLFVVRRDRDTEWAISFIQRLRDRDEVRVHLLSVQMPFDGHVRMFFSESQIRAIHQEDGEAELAPVCKALDAAGVPFVKHVAIGSSAETIAEYAREYRCRQIVMGPPKAGFLSQLLLGSLARQVEHLMQVAGQPCEVV